MYPPNRKNLVNSARWLGSSDTFCGFRVSTDGHVSDYPASPRARLPAEKREEAIPSRPSVNRRQGASVCCERTHPPHAARAAKHAERREQAELRLQQLACKMAKVQRWRR